MNKDSWHVFILIESKGLLCSWELKRLAGTRRRLLLRDAHVSDRVGDADGKDDFCRRVDGQMVLVVEERLQFVVKTVTVLHQEIDENIPAE